MGTMKNIKMAVGGPVRHSAPSEFYKGGDMMRTPDSFRGELPPPNMATDECFGKGGDGQAKQEGKALGGRGSATAGKDNKVEKNIKPRN
jgi:hypothetical protein